MARPTKRTVDYFPHFIKEGKTMMILESRYGNDGYAFWFKLLEILGSHDGHFYEYINTFEKEFLHAKTRVKGIIADEMLNLLADLGAIDSELWGNGIIWCDKFVDNIADAYTRRKVDVPQKPISKRVNADINKSQTPKTEQYDDIKPQIRLNNIKSDEIRGNNIVADSGESLDESYKYDIDSTYYQAAKYFRGKLLEYNPTCKVPKEEVKHMQKWADGMRKIFELDERTRDEFKQVMKFIDGSDFWQGVIMSPSGLRKNWDKLYAQSNKNGKSKLDNTKSLLAEWAREE